MALTLEAAAEQENLLLQKLKIIIKDSDDEFTASETAHWGDEILLCFLRCRQFNLQSTFERIKNCAVAITKSHKEIFGKLHPERLSKALNKPVLDILKNRDANGSRIVIFRYCNWDTGLLTADEVMNSVFLIAFELLLNEKETQESGFVFIWDLKDLSLSQAKQLTPAFFRRYLGLFNNSVPVKIPAIHILNAPRLFNMTISLVRYIIPKKLNKRINVHGSSIQSLHSKIPADILPPFYNGKLSEEDALENDLVSRLKTSERNDYYKTFFLGKQI